MSDGNIEKLDEYEAPDQLVSQLIAMYAAGLIEETAEALYGIDVSGLPADALEKLMEIKELSFRQTAQENYNSGALDYNYQRYDDAKVKLGKVLKFADPDVNFMPDVIYLLGLIAEQHDDDKDVAIRYYQMIVTNYPNSNNFRSAIEGIRRLSFD